MIIFPKTLRFSLPEIKGTSSTVFFFFFVVVISCFVLQFHLTASGRYINDWPLSPINLERTMFKDRRSFVRKKR